MLIEELLGSDWPVNISEVFVFIVNYCKIVNYGRTILRQVVMGHIRKPGKHKTVRKPLRSVLPWCLVSCG